MRNLLVMIGMSGLICGQTYGAAAAAGPASPSSDQENRTGLRAVAAVPAAALVAGHAHENVAGAGARARKAGMGRSHSASERSPVKGAASIVSGSVAHGAGDSLRADADGVRRPTAPSATVSVAASSLRTDADGVRRPAAPSVTVSVAASMIPDSELADMIRQLKGTKQKNLKLTEERAALQTAVSALEGRIGSLAAALRLGAGQDPIDPAIREHEALTRLGGILLPAPTEDMAAAATRFLNAHTEETRGLRASHAAELVTIKAANAAEVSRAVAEEVAKVRAEIETRMAAQARAHAEALGLLREEVRSSKAALAERNAEVVSLNVSAAATAVTVEEKFALGVRIGVLEEGARRLYRKALRAQLSATEAQSDLPITVAEKFHWREQAVKFKGYKSLPPFDPAKAEAFVAADKAIKAEVVRVRGLLEESRTKPIGEILATLSETVLASPLAKPRPAASGAGVAGATGGTARKLSMSGAGGAGVRK